MFQVGDFQREFLQCRLVIVHDRIQQVMRHPVRRARDAAGTRSAFHASGLPAAISLLRLDARIGESTAVQNLREQILRAKDSSKVTTLLSICRMVREP